MGAPRRHCRSRSPETGTARPAGRSRQRSISSCVADRGPSAMTRMSRKRLAELRARKSQSGDRSVFGFGGGKKWLLFLDKRKTDADWLYSQDLAPKTAPELEQRIRDALAVPCPPGYHKIAKQFGVGTGTVQR